MTTKAPPKTATRILKWVAGENEPLIGDLIEEYQRGRSGLWFWRQVMAAVFVRAPRAATLALLVLALYFAGTYIAIPGARDVLHALTTQRAVGPGPSQLFTVFFLGGGEMSWGTIFTLGITPYISAACLVLIAQWLWNRLPGNSPYRVQLPVVRLTWLVGLVLCMWQAAGFAVFLERVSLSSTTPIVAHPGMMFRLIALLMLTAGTTCLMFISDWISRHQMGNGMLIVFVAGTLAALPGIVGPLFSGAVDPFAILGVLVINTVIAAAISHGYQRAIAREVAV